MLAVFVVALLGALAGLLAGMLGIGGGIVIVPALVWVFVWLGFPPDTLMLMALGTSLASILFTGMSSVWAHHAAGAVRWRIFFLMAPTLMLGAYGGGSLLADLLGGVWLMRLFGIFAALIGLQMLFAGRVHPQAELPAVVERNVPGFVHAGSGGLVGVASAIFGIGGGSLVVPYLNATGIRMQQAVATSAACGVPIALAGAAGYIVAGWSKPDLPLGSLGYVHLPCLVALVVASMPMAHVGARLAHRLPAARLRRIFALLLILVAVDFLVR